MPDQETQQEVDDPKATTYLPLEDSGADSAPQTKVEPPKTDVETPSSGDEGDETDEEDIPAQIAGLTKELARVRKDRNSSAQEVQTLRERLAQVQGTLEGLSKSQPPTDQPLVKFSDDDLVQGQGEWEDALLEARDAARQARRDGDNATATRAEQAVSVARRTLQAIRKELLGRAKQTGADQARAQSDNSRVEAEIRDLYTAANQNFPELADKESDLWQAGKEEYDAHSRMMQALGPLGELVAVSMAVAKNPALVRGAKKGETRRELLSELDTKVEKALYKGTSKGKPKSAPDFSRMSASEFDGMIEKMKLGL